MSKPHSSLSPTANILLIVAWAAAAAAFLFVAEPHSPVMLAIAGAIFGAVGGTMQHLSITQASNGFLATSTLLEVRRALKATSWGSRYIRFLYFSKAALIALAFALIRQPIFGVIIGYFAGYFSLMFVREVVTLRDTYFLHRLSTNSPSRESNSA